MIKKFLVTFLLGCGITILISSKSTLAEELPTHINPSVQLQSKNSIYHTLYAIFPQEVFEQSYEMTKQYIWNPNTKYQDHFDYVEQHLYWQITRFLEPHINQAIVKQSLDLTILTPLMSPQAFLSLEKDEIGIFSYMHFHAVYPFLKSVGLY